MTERDDEHPIDDDVTDADLGAAAPSPVASGRRSSAWSRLYHGETDVNIVGRWKLWFAISGALVVVGLVALGVRQLNLGIDFTGGSVWEVPAGDATVDEVEDAMAELGYTDVQVQELTDAESGGRTLRVEAEAKAEASDATTVALDAARASLAEAREAAPEASRPELDGVRDALAVIEGPFEQDVPDELTGLQSDIDGLVAALPGATDPAALVSTSVAGLDARVDSLEVLERDGLGAGVPEALAALAGVDDSAVTVDTVGPSWGRQISEKARNALVVFLIAILLYITLRFEFRMAVATVVALLHDLLITVGVYAIFQFPVTPATVIAVLTILGFSIYDGIVVFDRVDENSRKLGKRSKVTYSEMANRSLNQVLMRSLNTSITALLPILSVLIIGSLALGASTLEEFGLALLVGLACGAYSSIFVATPLLALLKEREPKWRELRDRVRTGAAEREAALAGAGTGPVTDGHAPRPRKQKRRA